MSKKLTKRKNKEFSKHNSIFDRIRDSIFYVGIKNTSTSDTRHITLGKDKIPIPRFNFTELIFNDILLVDRQIVQIAKVNCFFQQNMNYKRWKK